MLVRRLVLAASALALTACGITGNFRHDPGYADFGSLQGITADSDFGISLGPLPLRIAGVFVKDDEELGPFLRELRAVRVYTFEGIEDAESLAPRIEKIRAELSGDGWLNVASVRDSGEVTSVFLRPDENFAHHGLAVIIEEPEELVLVNLIGNIRLDFFEGYMGDLDLTVPSIDLEAALAHAGSVSSPAAPAAETSP